MLTWLALRQAAMARHMIWNSVLEGSDPELRALHRDIVRAFYGF